MSALKNKSKNKEKKGNQEITTSNPQNKNKKSTTNPLIQPFFAKDKTKSTTNPQDIKINKINISSHYPKLPTKSTSNSPQHQTTNIALKTTSTKEKKTGIGIGIGIGLGIGIDLDRLVKLINGERLGSS